MEYNSFTVAEVNIKIEEKSYILSQTLYATLLQRLNLSSYVEGFNAHRHKDTVTRQDSCVAVELWFEFISKTYDWKNFKLQAELWKMFQKWAEADKNNITRTQTISV